MLRWARARGCPWDAFLCQYAAYGRAWQKMSKTSFKNTFFTLVSLVITSFHHMMFRAFFCRVRPNGGHLEVLQWARRLGCPWDEFTCVYAAKGGHMEVLQWAGAYTCPLLTST
jgi:hypothetical protein